MSSPSLTFQVDWTSGVVGKLSATPPFNCLDIIFVCNQHIKEFRARATFENQPRGIDKGVLITTMTDKPADTQIRFTLDGNMCLTSGDGTYCISLYVQNDQGEWNVGRLFITVDNEKFKVVTGDQLVVQEV